MNKHRKIYYITLAFLFSLAGILGFIIFSFDRSQGLVVTFLDVGQGDSILISRGSTQILIDGGPSGKRELEELGKHIPFWDRKIEMVIITHPDKDHLGGLIEVVGNYEVGIMVESIECAGTDTCQAWRDVLEKRAVAKIKNWEAAGIKLGDDLHLDLIFPFVKRTGENLKSNENSIVAKLAYGENTFLFTGDITTKEEDELINNGGDLDIDVLKVAHHGSKYSTGEDFLKAVTPASAVISVGKNSYGHPTEDVIERLEKSGAEVLRTDERGDIVCRCRNTQDPCEISFLD